MSFLIRGGYNKIHKSVTNIFLKETNKWRSGIITTQDNQYLENIEPDKNTIISMVKVNDKHYLTLNNRIVHEDRLPITYNVNLLSCSKEYNHGITDIGNFIKWEQICYEKMLRNYD
jgi:hypothetical protein